MSATNLIATQNSPRAAQPVPMMDHCLSTTPSRRRSSSQGSHPDDDLHSGVTRSTPSSRNEGEGSGEHDRSAPEHDALVPAADVYQRFPRHAIAMSTLVKRLSEDAVAAAVILGPTGKTQHMRKAIQALVDAACLFLWGDVGVALYGSFGTATALNASDLNLTMTHRFNRDPFEGGDEMLHTLCAFFMEQLSGLVECHISSRGRTQTPGNQRLSLQFASGVHWTDLTSLSNVMATHPPPAYRGQMPHRVLGELANVASRIFHDLPGRTLAQHGGVVVATVTCFHFASLAYTECFSEVLQTCPELSSFTILLKSCCLDRSLPLSQMSTHVLMWAGVAYYRYHLLIVGGHHSSPAQLLLGFMDFFRADGAFDPRLDWLCPGHHLGILRRSQPAMQSVWFVVDPFLPSDTVEALVQSNASPSAPNVSQHNLAANCYMVHEFRNVLSVALEHLLRDYGDYVVHGGVSDLLRTPLVNEADVNMFNIHPARHNLPPNEPSVCRLIRALLPNSANAVLEQ